MIQDRSINTRAFENSTIMKMAGIHNHQKPISPRITSIRLKHPINSLIGDHRKHTTSQLAFIVVFLFFPSLFPVESIAETFTSRKKDKRTCTVSRNGLVRTLRKNRKDHLNVSYTSRDVKNKERRKRKKGCREENYTLLVALSRF